MENKKSCVIFIDGDNFLYKGVSEIFSYIKKWNMNVLHKVVYGDFSELNMLNWKEVSLEHNLTSIQLWKKHNKNSVDMKMGSDILEMLYNNKMKIDVYIICTGDRDFVPIIDKIHLENKIVIGISTNSFGTSLLLKNECDDFYYVGNEKIISISQNMDISLINNDYNKFLQNDNIYIEKLKSIISSEKCKNELQNIIKDKGKNDKIIIRKVLKNSNNKIKFRKEDKNKVKREDKKKVKREDKREDKNVNLFKNNVIDEILENINFEEVIPSLNELKIYIIEYLKKNNKSLFVSQIKDELLRKYNNFNEKKYDCINFSSFIKQLAPEIKTKMESSNIIYAYID